MKKIFLKKISEKNLRKKISEKKFFSQVQGQGQDQGQSQCQGQSQKVKGQPEVFVYSIMMSQIRSKLSSYTTVTTPFFLYSIMTSKLCSAQFHILLKRKCRQRSICYYVGL